MNWKIFSCHSSLTSQALVVLIQPVDGSEVKDEDSRTRYSGEEGLFAEGMDTWVDFESWDWRLLGQVEGTSRLGKQGSHAVYLDVL